MDLYEIAIGIEKNRIRKTMTGKLTPWYWSFVALMIGIWRGNVIGAPLAILGETETHLTVLGIWIVVSVVFLITAATGISRLPKGAFKRRSGLVAWCLAWLIFGHAIGAPITQHLAPTATECTILAQAMTGRLPGESSVLIAVHQWNCDGKQPETGTFLTRLKLTDNESIRRGEGIRVKGKFDIPERADTPGTFDSKNWLNQQNIWLTFHRAGKYSDNAFSYEPLQRFEVQQSWLRRQIDAIRLENHAEMMPHSEYGIAPALSLGISKTLDPEVRQAFADLGIAHVLAVSGLHFGMIAIALTWFVETVLNRFPKILRRFGRRRAASVVSLAFLWLYVLVVGAPISAQRALLMMYACLFGRLNDRKPSSLRNLAFAGTIILVIDPNALFTASFQLSFGAVLGIFCTTELMQTPVKQWIQMHISNKRAQKLIEAITVTMIMTLGSTITTAPFAIWHFGQLPILGSFANLIAIPAVSFILLPLSLITAICHDIPMIGPLFTQLSSYSESCFVHFIVWLAKHIPLASVRLVPHPFVLFTFSVLGIALVLNTRAALWKRHLLRTSAVLATVVISISAISPSFWFGSDALRITFIAMGQADATLVEFPNGQTMLVDAGNALGSNYDMGTSHIVPYLKYLGINHIDTLVLTHPDYDHYAAMASILNDIAIDEFWSNGQTSSDERFIQLQNTLNDRQLYNKYVNSNSELSLSYRDQIRVLWPNPELSTNLQSTNDQSIVLKINYKNFSALLMGDATSEVETTLLNAHPNDDFNITLLKAGHHGSKYSTSESWLNATTPEFVLFSAGKNNRYKFPAQETLERTTEARAQILRTDTQGTIRITTDGNNIIVEKAL